MTQRVHHFNIALKNRFGIRETLHRLGDAGFPNQMQRGVRWAIGQVTRIVGITQSEKTGNANIEAYHPARWVPFAPRLNGDDAASPASAERYSHCLCQV